MRHLLALAACVAATTSIADASPKHKHDKKKHRVENKQDDDDVAIATPIEEERPIDEDEIDAKIALPPAPAKHDWHVAIGPDLWASSVDAKVSFGGQSITQSVGFFQTSDHARFGVPLVGEARFGRFSLAGDFLYGVIDLDGAKEVGPVMATLQGSASQLELDALAGVRILGESDSTFALEARAGLRYSRTVVAGSLGVDGSQVVAVGLVESSADALAGARLFVRPWQSLYLTGAGEIGLFGDDQTYSFSADANWRVTNHVLVSLGWKQQMTSSSLAEITMHGPRGAVQVLF
jgi:hypothetical protein